jgi:hypothetical protein
MVVAFVLKATNFYFSQRFYHFLIYRFLSIFVYGTIRKPSASQTPKAKRKHTPKVHVRRESQIT